MRVVSLSVRDFRCYETAQVALGEGLTVVSGPNGAGKTNLLEALYFGCTGRSCRTANEREVVRFGQGATRVVVHALSEDGAHELAVGFEPGQPKRMRADGAPVERLLDVDTRPLVSVFLPDRLELIKGPPSLRRAHLDQFVSAMWPARSASRRAYAQALAQRNALLARIRAGVAVTRLAVHVGSPIGRAWPRADARPWPGARRDRRRLRPARRRAGPGGRRRDPLPAAIACDDAGGARRRARRTASTATSSAASAATGPIATTSPPCTGDASCAPMALRGSSGWRCWRCCWPSARRSPLSATRFP